MRIPEAWVLRGVALVAVVALSACGAQAEPTPTPTIPAQPTAAAQPGAPSPSSTPPPVSAATASPLAPSPTAALDAALPAGEALVEALQRGGYVLYFRHAATDWSTEDTDSQNLENCETQRNLSEEGRADARAIGQAFQALDIPVDQVLSSRYCRTRETAQLAFGRVEPTRDLTSLPSAPDEAERERRVAALRHLLTSPPPAGANTILVGHLFNIQRAADLSIAEGEAAIFEPRGSEGFRLVGRVRPEEWGALLASTSTAASSEQESQPTLQEYPVPPGSRPHDVAPAPDGAVWYTAQGSGELGRLDPATGGTHHIKLGQGSAPHGVIVGPDGAPWITDGGLNAIVRVDPETEEVRRFPLPDSSGYANLNTATFDGHGVLWFTGQSGVYGRLDPAVGQVEVFEAPRGRGPYGITTTPSGEVYYASLAGSHIARVDTTTGEATVIEPPTPGQGARRIWSDSRGQLWVSEWNAGQLARYDPATNEWREWRLPGDQPRPYAVYVDDRDIVWLSDFGANALVRFDPAPQAFELFPLPSTPANVRQILGRPEEVWGAESGVDKLVVLRVEG